MREAVIVSTARTPIGKAYRGMFNDTEAPSMAAPAIAAAVERAGVEPAEVDDVIGRLDGLGVVLDHQHAVAEIAQPLQRFDEPAIVALVQTDGRLVEDVHDTGQLGSEL